MTRREAERLTHQENVLISLGFTQNEAESLRRISMTLRRWHELECGDGNGCIERDEVSGIPQWRYAGDTGKYCGRPIPDRETGAKKRLAAILKARNEREPGQDRESYSDDQDRDSYTVASLSAFIQTDPRGAALYIIRPGDVPEGGDVSAHYSRGVCVY